MGSKGYFPFITLGNMHKVVHCYTANEFSVEDNI